MSYEGGGGEQNLDQSGGDEGSATHAPRTTHQSQRNPKENARCKLLDYTGTGDVVAIGRISATNPQETVHETILGPLCWRVWVDLLVHDMLLFRATTEPRTLGDAIGTTAAWPHQFIELDD